MLQNMLAFYPVPLYAAPPSNVSAPSVSMSELWQRLRQARKYADITQMDLAKACGVTRGAVALWESAEAEHRTKPTTDHLIQISKRTRVPLEWLLNDAASTEALWKLTGEFGDGNTTQVTPQVTQEVTTEVVPEPDVLPDLRQGEHLFVFASSPAQISAKLALLAAEPSTTQKHLILVGTEACVRCVDTPAAALSAVVQALSQKP